MKSKHTVTDLVKPQTLFSSDSIICDVLGSHRGSFPCIMSGQVIRGWMNLRGKPDPLCLFEANRDIMIEKVSSIVKNLQFVENYPGLTLVIDENGSRFETRA